MRISEGVGKLRRSVALWPVTGVYLVGCGMLLAVTTDRLSLRTAILAFGVIAVLAVLSSMLVELRKVHLLVNSQHDALIARVNQLADALTTAGVDIPQHPHIKARQRRSHGPQ